MGENRDFGPENANFASQASNRFRQIPSDALRYRQISSDSLNSTSNILNLGIEFNSYLALSGIEFKLLQSSMLYVWIRNGIVLYVGISDKGLGRFNNHLRLNGETVLNTDIVIIEFLPILEAVVREKALIELFKPVYNIGVGNSIKNKRRRMWICEHCGVKNKHYDIKCVGCKKVRSDIK